MPRPLSGAESAQALRHARPARPTRADVPAAAGRTVPDVISSGLDGLFWGINPGLYSGGVGHHFARPGNRFWPVLHAAGFTPRVLAPWEERVLLDLGYGITNLVARATVSATELTVTELVAGARRLERKVRRYGPRWVAIVGIGAYRTAFGRRRAGFGRQQESLVDDGLWVLLKQSWLYDINLLPEFARALEALRKSERRTL